ncbi:MAG: DUF2267 domain-containing protein [Candidatus Saccharimonadales bacterium]
MGFKELVNQVQKYSGFTNQESKDALELMVESIAVRLDEPERIKFASQLPEFLSDIVLSVYPSEENSHGDLIRQFMEYEQLGEARAKKQVIAAWQALKQAISERQIQRILSCLPYSTTCLLS